MAKLIINNNWKNNETKDLFKAILELKSTDEVTNFFRDLMTEPEIIEFGKRWKAAQMLEQGKSYMQIVKETGLSSTTVARVSKWLNNGMNGYKLILSRIDHHHNHSDTLMGGD